MDPLVRYYLPEALGGRGDNGIGPIYSNPPFLLRGHGIGSFFGRLWLWYLPPLLWQGAKALGSEAIVTGRNISSDMAQITDPNTKMRDIVVET